MVLFTWLGERGQNVSEMLPFGVTKLGRRSEEDVDLNGVDSVDHP